MPPPLLSEQAAFARHLFTQGYPLWNPDPVSLPQHLQNVGLRIGDLGTIDERGRFHVFLNIFDPSPGSADISSSLPQINEDDVRCISDDISPREVVSSPETNWAVDDVEVSTIQGTTTRTTQYSAILAANGAHIVLPQGAQLSDLEPRHRKILECYAREHGADWLERYKGRLETPGSSSLYLLTGFYKTCSWCIASFGMETAANTDPVYVCCTTAEVDERIVLEQSAWRPTGRFKRKIGPVADRQGRNNQAIFIRGITITPNVSRERRKQQFGLLGRVFSGPSTQPLGTQVGDPSNAGVTDTSQTDVIIQRVPDILQASNLSEIVNRYLLTKVPSAQFAVTHDSQWMEMAKLLTGPSRTVQDMENHLDELIPKLYTIVICHNTVQLSDKVSDTSTGDGVDGMKLPLSDLASGVTSEETRNAFSSSSSVGINPLELYYICQWIMDHGICGSSVRGSEFPEHLRASHDAIGLEKSTCRWDGCFIKLNKDSLARHTYESHLKIKYLCDVCHEVFSRIHTVKAHQLREHGGDTVATHSVIRVV